MMKFISLALENFMSFRKRQVLPLDDLGLVLIKGDNRLSGATDSNGVGKTAILDALGWALFGQTLRGTKADEVACRFSKGQCRVGLLMEIDGKRWAIKRARRPSVLELRYRDGKNWVEVPAGQSRDVQEKIDALLGFGFRTFKNASVFGQGMFERFTTASQADQMRMIDEIQQLDLAHALAKSKEWRSKAEDRLRAIDVERFGFSEQATANKEQVEALSASRRDFAARKEASIEEAEGAAAAAKSEMHGANEALDGLEKRVQRVKSMMKELETVGELKTKLDAMDVTLDGLAREKTHLQEKSDEIVATVDELAKSDRCITCRVQLKGAVLAEMKGAFAPDLKDVNIKISVLERNLTPKAVEREQALRRYRDTEKGLRIKYQLESLDQAADLRLRFSDAVLGRQKVVFEKCEQKAQDAERAVQKEQDRKWDGDAPLKVAREQMEEIKLKVDELDAEKEKVAEALVLAEYWVEAFGDRGLRSLMFDSVADFLNRSVARHLEVLTAGEATVRFSALSALKKGGVREKISVESSWSWGADGYAGGSAGQSRRVDLAIFGALQDLAESRSARPFPLRIWDEAGDSLDARGKEIFAEWARVEARRRGTGFVVTHDREFGEILEPDMTWTVVMHRDGSSEVVVE